MNIQAFYKFNFFYVNGVSNRQNNLDLKDFIYLPRLEKIAMATDLRDISMF